MDEKTLAAAADLDHYLHHNELGLALEAAEALGKDFNSSPEFWLELERAAKSMALPEAAARYAARRDA